MKWLLIVATLFLVSCREPPDVPSEPEPVVIVPVIEPEPVPTISWVAPSEREDNTGLSLSEIDHFVLTCDGVERVIEPHLTSTVGVRGETCKMQTVDTDGRISKYSEEIRV